MNAGRTRWPGWRRRKALAFPLAVAATAARLPHLARAQEAEQTGNLIPNPGFEDGLDRWQGLWTRTAGAGRLSIDEGVDEGNVHRGRRAARIDHTGELDWSFQPQLDVPVQPGDLFELEVWLRLDGSARADVSVVTYDARGTVMEWLYGRRSSETLQGWQRLQSRFAVPDGIARLRPRLTGSGPGTVWIDDVSLVKRGNVLALRTEGLPAQLTIGNAALDLTFATADGTLSVLDKRTQERWLQRAVTRDVAVTNAHLAAPDGSPDGTLHRIEATLVHLPSGLTLGATIALDGDLPECTVMLEAAPDGELAGALAYPHPFVTAPGTRLVVPLNEGIAYPVEDQRVDPQRLITYGGHGLCMAFAGVTDGERGQMTLLETPDDAALRIGRSDTLLYGGIEWDGEQGRFGYGRQLRYVFFDGGGHVAMAKRYRAHVQHTGQFVSLAEKRAANPNVDLLVGAVNTWCWERDAAGIAAEMREAGIDRILWSQGQSPDVIDRLNALDGVLTSRYDIYQDVMDPATFPKLNGVHPDWPTEAWPRDIMIGADGQWTRGWEVVGKDGQRYACGVLCDQRAPAYAQARIAQELQTHAYRCRFIDTTTASPWRECYAPAHPQTRRQSRAAKMALLQVVSQEMGLVTGSETGHDAAVPYVHYFEGMLSLGPYRVPDAGRDVQRIWDEVPERVATFQLGHQYRLPLWELVYHDAVVAHWYWGDYTNKLPALWDQRDLFNVLYGTAPMFMFDRALWRANRERFAQSYRVTGPVARATGYAEMTDHRFLTADRSVQQTTFANGLTVTVNFGATDYQLPNGPVVPPMSSLVA